MRLKAIIGILCSWFGFFTSSYAAGEEDIFQPRMPEVKQLADIEVLFEQARKTTVKNALSNDLKECFLIIVTPNREFLEIKCAEGIQKQYNVSKLLMEPARRTVRSILHSNQTLDISVIANTNPIINAKDRLESKSISFFSQLIPFFGYLLAMCELGHRTVVFEGHSSALLSGVRNTDILFVDSGMIPFLQEDWMTAAFEVMRPSSRIFVHERFNYSLHVFERNGSITNDREIQLSGFEFLLPDGFRLNGFPDNKENVVATKMGNHGSLIFEAGITDGLGPMNERVVDFLLKRLSENSPQGLSAFSYHDRRLIQVNGVTSARVVAEWLLDPHGTRTLLYIFPRSEKLAVLQYTATANDWEEVLPIFEASAMATKGLTPSTLPITYYLGLRTGDFIGQHVWWLVGLVLLWLVFRYH